MDLGLRDKIVLVTGAASGIGAAVARAFCVEGTRTVFTDVNEKGLAAALKGYERKGTTMVCDVSNPRDVRALFHEVKNLFGTLHVLVNAAAINTAEYIDRISEGDLKKVLDVNVRGYVYTTREAIPLMKAAGYGRLIYINSGSGLKASAGLSLYSASKYFNRGFAISAALEAGKYRITSNSICPSDVYPGGAGGENGLDAKSWKNTQLVRISLEKEGVDTFEALMEKRREKNPMKRSCTTADIASLALFLASERAGFINGQSIGVNGGLLPY
jgi:NAD(P)-dependent dehydrogenase (short-subunit alcohol dehydrogenase family)